METPADDLPHYVQVMWSVPYDYNTYNAYLVSIFQNVSFFATDAPGR
jgi:hypothetical protein